MAVINTNVSASIASNALVKNERSLSKAMAQLSTGNRINNAGDDAAGLAISETMTAQIRGLAVGVRNANDGISMAQTADGALAEATNILQRMRELATQARSGQYSTTQLGYLDAEYQDLVTAMDAIATSTEFNGTAILSAAGDGTFNITGAAGTTLASVTTYDLETSAAAYGDITSAANATTELTLIDGAAAGSLAHMVNARASLGASMNALAYVADAQSNEMANTQASRSRIMDTDYASATTELARTQIIQQAGTAMLAQANQLPQTVLSLLQ